MTLRSLPFAALLMTLLAAPALAGPAEDTFLAKLVGSWSGKGTLTGAESGVVDCSMSFRQRSAGVTFRGKCDVTGFGAQTFSGTLSYNDKLNRYEAASASGDITPGVKSGKSVVFTTKLKGLATGQSVMKLSTTRVVVDTTVKRSASSGDIKSHIELKR
jgi:hypothetical protein